METIKVRIRICVDEQGNWNAAGWGGPYFTYEVDDACVVDPMPGKCHEAWHWIEAEVPLPKSGVIQGRVGE